MEKDRFKKKKKNLGEKGNDLNESEQDIKSK